MWFFKGSGWSRSWGFYRECSGFDISSCRGFGGYKVYVVIFFYVLSKFSRYLFYVRVCNIFMVFFGWGFRFLGVRGIERVFFWKILVVSCF